MVCSGRLLVGMWYRVEMWRSLLLLFGGGAYPYFPTWNVRGGSTRTPGSGGIDRARLFMVMTRRLDGMSGSV